MYSQSIHLIWATNIDKFHGRTMRTCRYRFVFCFILLYIVAQQFIGFKLKPIQNYQHKNKTKSEWLWPGDSEYRWVSEWVSEWVSCVLCCLRYWRIYTAQALHKIRIITIFGYLIKSHSVSQSSLNRILFVWVLCIVIYFPSRTHKSNIPWRHHRNVSTKLNFP